MLDKTCNGIRFFHIEDGINYHFWGGRGAFTKSIL
jgi:hypothetical protein